MTDLRSALERYLSLRQGLGYKYQHQARRLADFVSFMETRKAATITTKLAVAWATLPPDRHASWALRLTDVRGFARHVANIDPQTEVPPAGIVPPLKRAKPYVYSDAEIDALLAAALALPPAGGLRRWTYYCLFGLIAVTGMRLSEAIGLQRDDVDLDNGVLTVRQTKFGKSRLVPLHPTTRAVLPSYAERRDAHLGSRCGPNFFVAERGSRLLHQYVPPGLLAIVSGDWATPPRRSHRATRARLPASVRDPHAPRLVSQGARCRATASSAFHLSRPHLRA
jgi:integrase